MNTFIEMHTDSVTIKHSSRMRTIPLLTGRAVVVKSWGGTVWGQGGGVVQGVILSGGSADKLFIG